MFGEWPPRLALLAAAVAFVLALRSGRRGRGDAIAWLLLGGAALRLYAAFDGFVHAWDERFHVLVARNLIAHPLRPTLYETPLLPYDYRDWTANHVWLHKPPLALWLMAASMRLFGVSELAARLPSLALSTAATYATYRLGKTWRSEAVGLLAASFQAVNAFLILLAAGWVATDHVDTAVVSLVGLAVAAGVGGGGLHAFAAAGALSGLAVLSKSWFGLLPLGVLFLWHRGRLGSRRLLAGLALGVVLCVAIALPWWVYAAQAFPLEATWERNYTWRHILEPLEGHQGSVLFHIARLPRIYGELIYLPLAWLLIRLGKGLDPPSQALAAWILLPYLLLSPAASKMPAYVMVASPAVFLVQAGFCVWLFEQWGGPAWRRLALGLVLAGVAGLPVRIALNDLRLFREHDRHPTWVAELRHLSERLEGKRAVIFGTSRPIETMLYTSQTAYAAVPDSGTLASLQQRGYLVAIYDAPDLADEIRHLPGVLLLSSGPDGPGLPVTHRRRPG